MEIEHWVTEVEECSDALEKIRCLMGELEERKKGRDIVPAEACPSRGSLAAAPPGDTSPATGGGQLVTEIAKLYEGFSRSTRRPNMQRCLGVRRRVGLLSAIDLLTRIN